MAVAAQESRPEGTIVAEDPDRDLDGRARGQARSNICASSFPTCTACRARRPCPSTRSRLMPAAASISTAACSASTRRRTWCRQAACMATAQLRRPGAVSRSGIAARHTVAGEDSERAVPRLLGGWRAAARRAALGVFRTGQARQCARLRRDDGPRIRILPAVVGDEGRLFEGIHIFHTVRNQYTPFLDQLVPHAAEPTASMSSPTIANMAARSSRQSTAPA